MSVKEGAEITSIKAIGKVLLDEKRPLKERFRALFTLKNFGGETAISSISDCFTDPSALLKHECAYCLGQMQDVAAITVLVKVLQDRDQDPMVRHEAGEALGAIGNDEILKVLETFASDSIIEVAETCQLAVERIKWLKEKPEIETNLPLNPYQSIDPAPPVEDQPLDVLTEKLLNEELSLFERYRAMFTLRNKGGPEAASALARGLKCKSALFRHEIAYVLGQMQEAVSVEQLKENLMDVSESPMVRHECAEALGSIATQECMDILQKYVKDKERVVKESCEVALDMCEYENSEEFQYADTFLKLRAQEES